MSETLKKFQILLEELFQFDCSDLDFGIYRIMNHKRQVIERFIYTDLPKAIENELKQGALAEQSQAAKELEAAKKKILDALGDDALDAAGNLSETYFNTKAGKVYLALQERDKSAKSHATMEATIYNHLHAFFSRYYQDGDFISKRRYSKKNRYAIPYNGEEVMLYWANHDQYYIKTGEYFNDYNWKAPNGATVRFKLKTADVEQNNVKGDKRFFLPKLDEIAWDETAKSLTILFDFRPLSAQEAISFSGKNQQEVIIDRAIADIPKRLSPKTHADVIAAFNVEKSHSKNDNTISYLEHHLRQYTKRNTSDFFIHKDLKNFLEHELDFYLKNEVINLEEMEAAGEKLSEGWFQMMRLIKKLGSHIIGFLAQIENFQKMLWEKRKFITEVFYCITLNQIPKEFFTEIATCEKQWEEWKELLSIDEGKGVKNKNNQRIEFLKAHPTLMLDTRHFSPEFTDRLLAGFDNLEENTDGQLVNSENWQALHLLAMKYREQVKCVYIDPPYNTDASAILYKNDYKDSSWLTLMQDRLNIAKSILELDGILCIAIDDEESDVLRLLLQNLFPRDIGTAVIRSNPAGRKTTGSLAPAHEYAMFYGKTIKSVPGSLERPQERLSRYPLEDAKGRYAWANFIRSGSGDKRSDRPTMFFPIYVNSNDSIRVPKMEWDSENRSFIILEKPTAEEVVIWPVVISGQTKIEKRWHRGPDRVINEPDEFRVRHSADGVISVDFKTRMDEDAIPTTWWDEKLYASANYGAAELKSLFGYKSFDFAKAVRLTSDCISVCAGANINPKVLDFFAGSGTSGHAVINLNREDGGRRKFILIEMAQYFDTVLLPRIKKVTFSPEWKDGKPKRIATPEEAERSPRIIKVIRLESYEDSLNNISFDDPSSQQALQFEDYLLQYMLQWETRHSETLLNVEKLIRPFSYKLHIFRDGETRVQTVDLAETFNYLLGLHVQKRKLFNDNDRRYLVYHGITQKGGKVAVLWRDTDGWKEKDYKRDKEFVVSQKLIEGADEVYVNGDSYIPDAQALEPLFKARMFTMVEA